MGAIIIISDSCREVFHQAHPRDACARRIIPNPKLFGDPSI
jgi:hypothetical protein